MKIVFNNQITDSEIEIEQYFPNSCLITIKNTSSGGELKSLDHCMTKEELREFIGGLLHIQSKLIIKT